VKLLFNVFSFEIENEYFIPGEPFFIIPHFSNHPALDFPVEQLDGVVAEILDLKAPKL